MDPNTHPAGKTDSANFDAFMDARERRIIEQIGVIFHDSETRLLQAFYGIAEAINKRFDQVEHNMAFFLDRLGTTENRILEVEKRLNIPPVS